MDGFLKLVLTVCVVLTGVRNQADCSSLSLRRVSNAKVSFTVNNTRNSSREEEMFHLQYLFLQTWSEMLQLNPGSVDEEDQNLWTGGILNSLD